MSWKPSYNDKIAALLAVRDIQIQLGPDANAPAALSPATPTDKGTGVPTILRVPGIQGQLGPDANATAAALPPATPTGRGTGVTTRSRSAFKTVLEMQHNEMAKIPKQSTFPYAADPDSKEVPASPQQKPQDDSGSEVGVDTTDRFSPLTVAPKTPNSPGNVASVPANKDDDSTDSEDDDLATLRKKVTANSRRKRKLILIDTPDGEDDTKMPAKRDPKKAVAQNPRRGPTKKTKKNTYPETPPYTLTTKKRK